MNRPNSERELVQSQNFQARKAKRCEEFVANSGHGLFMQRGIQVLELLIVIAIIGVLGSIAYPSFQDNVEQQRILDVKVDLQNISLALDQYFLTNGRYPDNLAEVGGDRFQDPWGNPYAYMRILGATGGRGLFRKDKSLAPVNSDYDLYSLGKDGATSAPFTVEVSFDDVVRCNNGRYYGLAADY